MSLDMVFVLLYIVLLLSYCFVVTHSAECHLLALFIALTPPCSCFATIGFTDVQQLHLSSSLTPVDRGNLQVLLPGTLASGDGNDSTDS